MPSINLTNLSFSFTSLPLLENLSLHVGQGERACLIGPNGCGKSTLLRIISGDIVPDSGSVVVDCGKNDALSARPLAHTFPGSVKEFLDAALAELRGLASRFEEVSTALATTESAASAPAYDSAHESASSTKRDSYSPAESSSDISEAHTQRLMSEYDSLLSRMTVADAWALDARIDETLAGLGLAQLAGEGRERRTSTLSPGQLARLELATTLLLRPPVLLLDEPTNHLDSEAVDFLSAVLRRWHGPVMLTSHDRAFIDDVATVIFDLDTAAWEAIATANGSGKLPGVYRCSGNYSDYLEHKYHARQTHRELYSSQQAQKRSLREHRESSQKIAKGGVRLASAAGMQKKFFSDRASATAVRRTRHDDRQLEIIAEREVRKPRQYMLHVNLKDSIMRSGLAVSARKASIDGRLAEITFDVAYGEHMLVTGPNGAGKSTLLRWIAEGEPPSGKGQSSQGSLTRAEKTMMVPQNLPQLGDEGFGKNIWLNGIGEQGKGIIHPSLWNTPIGDLSAGNQRRAQIAVAFAQDPDILIIDEPTNYLDLDTLEALEKALFSWKGTLIIASHDRWLIEHWKEKRLNLR